METHYYCENKHIPSFYHSVRKFIPFFILTFVPLHFHSTVLLWGYKQPTQSLHTKVLQILMISNVPFTLMKILNPNPEYVHKCQAIGFSILL